MKQGSGQAKHLKHPQVYTGARRALNVQLNIKVFAMLVCDTLWGERERTHIWVNITRTEI